MIFQKLSQLSVIVAAFLYIKGRTEQYRLWSCVSWQTAIIWDIQSARLQSISITQERGFLLLASGEEVQLGKFFAYAKLLMWNSIGLLGSSGDRGTPYKKPDLSSP